MIKINRCPKCKNGIVTFDRDHYGWYEYCIHCGYIRDLVEIEELNKKQVINTEKRQGTVKASN